MNAGVRDAPFGPDLTEMLEARCADAAPASTPKPRTPSTRKMLPATWQRTNPTNPVNECGGTGMPPSALTSRQCPTPATPDAAPSKYATPASTPKPRTPSTQKMLPATWQRTNPANPVNERRGRRAFFVGGRGAGAGLDGKNGGVYTGNMELEYIFRHTAFKHGLGEADIRRAFETCRYMGQYGGRETVFLLLGFDAKANPVEILYNELGESPDGNPCVNVFHAVPEPILPLV